MTSPEEGQIDPGEAFAAVIGVNPILSKRVESISDKQKRDVLSLTERIGKLCKSLIRGTIIPSQPDSPDYFKVLDLTSGKIDTPQIIEMISEIPDGAQLPYMTVANKIYSTLQNSIPKSGSKTITGSDVQKPNETELLKFNELYWTLDDPVNYAIGAMADGSMMPDVANAMNAVYPSLSAYITGCIHAEISSKGKGKWFPLPWRVNVGISSWLGIVQEPAIPAPPIQPQEKPANSEGESPADDKADMTQTERVAAGVK